MSRETVDAMEVPSVAALKAKAAGNERSLQQAIDDILRKPRPLSVGDRVTLLRLVRAMTPEVPQTDSAELIREDRDSR